MEPTVVVPATDALPCARVTDRERKKAIEEWMLLEEIARREPSLPIYQPRTRRERALWVRVDAYWRAMLARARSVDVDPGSAGRR